jgi:phosphoglycolate phosphatase
MKRGLFVFDLDGTLLDTENQITSTLLTVLNRKEIFNISNEEIRRAIGLPLDQILKELKIPNEFHFEITDNFREILKFEIKNGVHLFEGVIDFLKQATDQNYILGIATSKPTYLAEISIHNSLLNQFEFIIKGTDDSMAKPNPAVIHRVIQEAKTFEFAIMFGDRVEDMQAAFNAKIPSIGIAQSSHSKSSLLDAGASMVFESFVELNHEFWK